VFDFRYHALSLVAVFLALGIGIVLGATIGDNLVSQANKDLNSSLRGDLLKARQDARNANGDVAERDRLIQAAFPRIVGNRLSGKRVALVAMGKMPQDVESSIRKTIGDAGATVDSATVVTDSMKPEDIGKALGGRFANVGTASSDLRALGRRLGRVVVKGGGAAEPLKDRFADQFNGDYAGADAVAFYRADPDKRDVAHLGIEQGLAEGLRRSGVPAVGVELSGTDPSQVPWYVDRGMSSVDSIDLAGGRVALALALAGAEGSFGIKKTAQDPLPRPAGA
jgi:Copper transport outer membrane protein, MctB